MWSTSNHASAARPGVFPRRRRRSAQRRARLRPGQRAACRRVPDEDRPSSIAASSGALLQQFGGDLEQLRLELGGGLSAPPSRSSPSPAKRSRPCRRDAVGLAVDHTDLADRRPEASAQIWAITVSTPWPTDAAPVTTSTLPSRFERRCARRRTGRARSSRRSSRCRSRPVRRAAGAAAATSSSSSA